MTSPNEMTIDHQMAAEGDKENPQPVAPAAAWHPGATAVASPADESKVAASESTRWHEIQVMFVDDPRSAVETAAGLVDDSSQALVAFVKEQQDSLRAAWHGEDAGTEELRVALQHYRAFGTRLADFSREMAPTGARPLSGAAASSDRSQ
jgi:hypothetical protein